MPREIRRILIRVSEAEKSFDLYPKFNFAGRNMYQWKTKNFEQIKENQWISKSIVGIFEISKNAVASFPKIIKITKIHKSGEDWHFYLSIKQIITLEIIINSLSGRNKRNAALEF